MSETGRRAFRIGAVEIAPDRNLLTGSGGEEALEPRVMDVLCALAEADGAVCAREALIDAVWGVQYGADESLTRAISLIRKSMRAAGEVRPVVETIPKRGYRLALPVEAASDAPGLESPQPVALQPDSPAQRTVAAGRRVFDRRTLAAGLAALMAVAVLSLAFSLRGDGDPSRTQLDAAAPKSVAVLPFTALSEDESDAYFGKGLAEELLNALGRFPDLHVAARTSAFSFDGSADDAAQAAERLGVAYTVTGSVRRLDERVRATARLQRMEDGAVLWTETYETDEQGLFTIEDDIVREVAAALQARLGVGASAGRASGDGIDPIAYEQYLEGLALWGDRMRKDDTRARALAAFERAVAFDPDFADAWAAIGVVGAYSAGSPLARDRKAFRARAEASFLRALEIDGTNARAHAGLAICYVSQRIDVGAARAHLASALDLAPNAAQTHVASAWFHRTLGDADAAMAALDRAIALDPLNMVLRRVRAEFQVSTGDADEAFVFLDACRRAHCLGEGFIAYAAAAAVFSGDPDRMRDWAPAIAAFEKRLVSIPDARKPHVARINPAFFSIRLDRPDKNEQIKRIRRIFEGEQITDTIGMWGPTLADILPDEQILDLLHLAYERGDLFSTTFAETPLYGVNPYPDWVLEHPRYHALWERPGMGELAAALRGNGVDAGLPR
ncbi:MAG: winged helix-turn-helix domain-containing protein [Pseudomonadota bacterium]